MTLHNQSIQPLVFTVVKNLDEIHQAFLSLNLVDDIPFNQYDYLELLSSAKHKDVKPYFLMYHRAGRLEGMVHLQKINFLGGNILPFIVDPEAGRDLDLMSKMASMILPKMHWQVLSIGNVFFTQDSGIYLSNQASVNKYDVLDAAIAYLLEQTALSFDVLMVNNMYNYELDGIALMNKWNFAAFQTDPDMQFSAKSWPNYEAYLNSMNSKYRVRTRRVYSKSEDVKDVILSVDQIEEQKDILDQLYRAVTKNAKLNFASLPSRYFFEMKKKLGNDFIVRGYFIDGQMIGFMSYFKSTSLWAHYTGLDYSINQDKQLYNRMLCDLVKEGVEDGHDRVYFGRTAVEIKSTLGASPMDMKIYLRHKGNCRQNLIKRYEQKALPISYEYRSPFKKNSSGAADRQFS